MQLRFFDYLFFSLMVFVLKYKEKVIHFSGF